ncbi:hypothetical protein LT493_08980 [Streptomyces tricolor]|nr:hypothetical protein [Streptomyces tricolor]
MSWSSRGPVAGGEPLKLAGPGAGPVVQYPPRRWRMAEGHRGGRLLPRPPGRPARRFTLTVHERADPEWWRHDDPAPPSTCTTSR